MSSSHDSNHLSPAICQECGEEYHEPVDCATAQKWKTEMNHQAVRILTVPPAMIRLCINRAVLQMVERHGINHLSHAQALEILAANHWNVNVCLETPAAAPTTQPMVVEDYVFVSAPDTGDSKAAALIKCGICFEEYPAADLQSLAGCDHLYCQDCWEGYLRANMVGPAAIRTTCPAIECQQIITRTFLEKIDPNLVPEYDFQVLASFLGTQNSLRFCPGPDCPCVAVRKDVHNLDPVMPTLNLVTCSECQTSSCFDCGQAFHGKTPCQAANPEEEQENQLATTTIRGTTSNDRVKNCPSCSVSIQKIGGCNRMRCRCRRAFCWICLADMTDGYNHICDQGGRRVGQPAAAGGQFRNSVDLDFLLDTIPIATVAGSWTDNEATARMLDQVNKMERHGRLYNRYLAHHHGQIFAQDQQQGNCLQRKVHDYTHLSTIKSGTHSDFIMAANEILVVARRFLKYSVMESLPSTRSSGSGDVQMEQEPSNQELLYQNQLERLGRFTEETEWIE